MNWYPQIGAGSLVQLPVSRSRRWRSINNRLENGAQIVLPDSTAGKIAWQLTYQDLTNAEVQNLSNLFSASQGQFGAFTFIDPMANLLGWSEKLNEPIWQAGLLHLNSGMSDPVGTQRAWSVANPNPGAQALQQTLVIPGNYVTCFSAYLWSGVSGTVTLRRDSGQTDVTVGPAWKRVYLSGAGANGTAQATFSIVLAAGQSVNLWGLQVEVQPYPSTYKQTNAPGGIYEETYFGVDELTVTSTGAGLSSCEIVLISRV